MGIFLSNITYRRIIRIEHPVGVLFEQNAQALKAREVGSFLDGSFTRTCVEMDFERLNIYFLTRPLLYGAGEFSVSRTNNVPEFSFTTVGEGEICDAVMFKRLDAAGVDAIPLSCDTCADPYL
jgi:hypothetical protein